MNRNFFLNFSLGPLAHFRMEEAGGDSGGGTPATPTTPSASSGASATPAAPVASQTATPAPGVSQTPATPAEEPIADGDFRTLRTRYESVKAKAAVLDQLGIDANDLPSITKQFTKLKTEFSTLAAELGYTDPDDLKGAWDSDPVQALAVLRAEKAQAARNPPPAAQAKQPGETNAEWEARVEKMVNDKTKPFTDHINKQISDGVVTKIGTETTAALAVAIPNAPPEVAQLVTNYVNEYFSNPNNQNLIVAMKARGDYSSVSETVKFVAGELQNVFKAWYAAEIARTGGRRTATPTPGTPAAQGKGSGPNGRITLDDMISNPELLGDEYK